MKYFPPFPWRAVLFGALLLASLRARAVVPGEVIYVADINTGAIKQFNSVGQGSPFASLGTVNPSDMALDSAGNLYVANLSAGVSGNIQRINPLGQVSLFTANVNGPASLTFDGSGTLYAGMVMDNTVRKYD